MKALSNYHPNYTKVGASYRDLGKKLKHIDESESYEEDEAMLLVNTSGKYTLIAASGCSCWDGDWEGWTDLTATQVKRLGETWSKEEYGSGKTLGEWINNHFEAKS